MKRNYNILIADSDCYLIQSIKEHIYDKGCILDAAFSESSAEDKIENSNYDLFLLNLSTIGLSLCKKIRDKTNAPIIFINRKADESLVVAAYLSGADGVVHRPIYISGFCSSFLQLAEKYYYANLTDTVYINGIQYNRSNDNVVVDGKPVRLTLTETKILKKFINSPNTLITKKELLRDVWDWEDSPYTSIVSTNISRLRKKIGDDKITTIKNKGYMLIEECT